MGTILAVTNNTNSIIKLVQCVSHEEAVSKMKSLYSVLCMQEHVDYNNTYIDEALKYAQIVNGLEQIEMRIGTIE